MIAASTSAAVVDASVAVKWLFDELHSDLAERLYLESVAGGRPLFAPPLFPNEVTNAIYRRLRRGVIEEPRADAALARFNGFRLDVRLLDLPNLTDRAYALAKHHRLGAIYDALYVVLAEELDADLWTDDQTLVNALTPAAPWVRRIGDYPSKG